MVRFLFAALRRRPWRTAAVLAAAAVAVAMGALYFYAGFRGFRVMLRHGGTFWSAVAVDDARLSPAMRMALRDEPPAAVAGAFAWETVAPGFEVAELPVVAEGAEVDRLLLARIEPRRFRFVVRNAPAGDRELGDWMRALDAALVINGSYVLPDGTPATPIVSAGRLLGPKRYGAKHGAFVAGGDHALIGDLASGDWPTALAGAEEALVSFPLLVGPDGASRVSADRHWLANRSFAGEDGVGRIVLGTTADAFFSLDRLARFLGEAPLDLVRALNLDGGPIACQGIALAAYRRDFCGRFELARHRGRLELLTWGFGSRRADMPLVLAVLPR